MLIEILFLSIFIIYGGLFLSTPNDKAIGSDIIVILGGGTADRLKKGISLYKQGFSEKVLITGFPNLNISAVPTYLKWRTQFLIEAGVPRSSIILNGSARSSIQEASFIRDYLTRHALSNALIISDPPHLRRLSFIFTEIFSKHSQLSYCLISSEPKWWTPNSWWKNKYSAQFVIMEAIKLQYYLWRLL